MELLQLCLTLGASGAERIPMDKVAFAPELRALCAQNACGRFARNYTCPPHIGEVEALMDRLKGFSEAVIWQSIFPLEDSFDFEGMMDAQSKHNAMTLEVARRVYRSLGRDNALVLGAGGCSLCESCALQTGEPCRNREDALSSLEAYGIHVAKTCEALEMNYINGANTVTYFSGVFTR